MSVAGFVVLLAIAIIIRMGGNRLFPLLMPGGRLSTLALGWAGGFAASWLDDLVWQFGPQVAGVNLPAAFVGGTIAVLCLGIVPFVRIMLGKR